MNKLDDYIRQQKIINKLLQKRFNDLVLLLIEKKILSRDDSIKFTMGIIGDGLKAINGEF